MISKNEARILGKTMRKSISSDLKKQKEHDICKYFLSLPELTFCQNICVYLPIGSEVDTSEIIDSLLRLNKSLYAPVTVGDDMYVSKFDANTFTKIGNYGIKEPTGVPFDKNKLDLIITPLIAFNKNKDRVGYGKGYYDRFIPASVLTVGIAFSEQEFVFEKEDFDKSLDIIVTDEGVLR